MNNLFVDEETADAVASYLEVMYRGIFTPEAIRTHLVNHVGFSFADYAVAVTRNVLPEGARVLDLGCGFGSFVFAAREAGYNARGIELAAFEIKFARTRLRRCRPQDDPDTVYHLGDARELAESSSQFDGVTLWNVLEHIEDAADLLRSVDTLLKPGGHVLIVCPNYDANRQEAHYHVPWTPSLSRDRAAASTYLRSLGRDPTFFETSIFCRTQTEIVSILRGLNYQVFDLPSRRNLSFRWRDIRSVLKDLSGFRALRDPAKHSVELIGRKPFTGTFA